MKREWFYYMLGRLVCGDDSLVQAFNGKPTNKFRYQIQAKDYDEGFVWGKICAREVFGTKKYYFYQKKDGLYNTVINLTKEDVRKLFDNCYVSQRNDFQKFKKHTALAVIKAIPIQKLLKLEKEQIAEFLAGCFDSDGSIRPERSMMIIYLDTQINNRTEPLAYEQIKLLKYWAEERKAPRLLRIEIVYPPKLKGRAEDFFKGAKKLLSNTTLIKTENTKGVTMKLNFSCDVRTRSFNRDAWMFWIKEVVPRFLRKDKKSKFLKFYTSNKKHFCSEKPRLPYKFSKDLARYINSQSYISVRRPKCLQCEIKIYFRFSSKAKALRGKIKKYLKCAAYIYKKQSNFFVSFYLTPKIFPEFEKIILPLLNRNKGNRIVKFLKDKNRPYL